MSALTMSERCLLKLIRKGRDAEGWAKVSAFVWPVILLLPSQLVELRPGNDGGHARLTPDGEVVLNWS